MGNIDITTLCRPLKEFFEDECRFIGSTDVERELLLLHTALSEKINKKENIINIDIDASKYYLYCLIAYLEGKESNDFSILNTFILNPNKDLEEAIFRILHRKRGVQLYNQLLKESVDYLIMPIDEMRPLDPFLVDNSSKLYKLLSGVSDEQILDSSQVSFTKISFEEFDNLCREYLIRIDPTLKWLSLYLDAKSQGNIIFVTGEEHKWEAYRKEGINYLIAPLTNTLEDVSSMIHEFIHYIILSNIKLGEQIPLTLGEFPSLFFELDLYDFLIEKGFSEQEVKFLKGRRIGWTQEDSLVVLPYLYYLAEYQKVGELTQDFLERKINEKNQNINEMIKKIAKSNIQISLKDSIAHFAENECYVRNTFLIGKTVEAMKRYPYVIGMYLANVTHERQEKGIEVIPDIIQYTETLGRISPEVVFAKLEIEMESSGEKAFQKGNKKD